MEPRPALSEIFLVALRLGCTSFGGPLAHLAYFRKEYVGRLRWLDDAQYADLVALCQFLPGPASSQTGFGVGYLQRGMMGGLAAWLGFTLPSAVLMIAFAYGVNTLGQLSTTGYLQGLKAASVAVVAQAVWLMSRSLTPDWPRRSIAIAAAAALWWLKDAWSQVAVIALGAAVGWLWFKAESTVEGKKRSPENTNVGLLLQPDHHRGITCLVLFFILLGLLPALSQVNGNAWLAAFDRFYRSGALVFGGGHAVLPMLEREVVSPGWLSHDQFLAGYGAAQALPGPLFAFSAYLGCLAAPLTHPTAGTTHPIANWVGGAWTLGGIFLPGLLLVAGTLPFWQRLRRQVGAQAALRGANAAVVGVLLAAFYNPVWINGVTNGKSFAIAAVTFVALQTNKVPVWAVVMGAAALGRWWL